LIRIPDGRFIACVRLMADASTGAQTRTALCWLDCESAALTEFLALPSGGDTSYAGMVVHDGMLWVSYYSSHEDKSAVYLAKLQLDSDGSGDRAGGCSSVQAAPASSSTSGSVALGASPMKGFDSEFADITDYILKITEEIWEGRGLATLHRYYSKDIIVRMPSGLDSSGNAGVITGTLATLAEFPDRRLLGEDVIWSGDDEQGFMSSHRILTTGTHTGHGAAPHLPLA
jgi:hypothetical protein